MFLQQKQHALWEVLERHGADLRVLRELRLRPDAGASGPFSIDALLSWEVHLGSQQPLDGALQTLNSSKLLPKSAFKLPGLKPCQTRLTCSLTCRPRLGAQRIPCKSGSFILAVAARRSTRLKDGQCCFGARIRCTPRQAFRCKILCKWQLNCSHRLHHPMPSCMQVG